MLRPDLAGNPGIALVDVRRMAVSLARKMVGRGRWGSGVAAGECEAERVEGIARWKEKKRVD